MIGNPRVETLRTVAASLRRQADEIDRIADILGNGWQNAGIAITRLMDHACSCQPATTDGFITINPNCPIHRPGGFKSLLTQRNGELDQEHVRRILRAIGKPKKIGRGKGQRCRCKRNGHDPVRNPMPGCPGRRHGQA